MTTNEEEVSVGHLEEEAQKRKERLKALRQKLQGKPDEDEETKSLDKSLPKPAFRSYIPKDEGLQGAARPMPLPVSIEEAIADTLEQGEVKTLLDDVELTNLAPRKPDWDLKRDIAPKLQKLERRTQRAIAELILERLRESQDDLAVAVQLADEPRLSPPLPETVD